MLLSQLPNELLLIIADKMNGKSINALMRTSHHFYALLYTLLYQHDMNFACLAIKRGVVRRDMALLKRMLDIFCDTKCKTKTSQHRLWFRMAVQSGMDEFVKLVIDTGFLNVEARDTSEFEQCLFLACYQPNKNLSYAYKRSDPTFVNLRIVEYLLAGGISNPNMTFRDYADWARPGVTSLIAAIHNGKGKIVEALLASENVDPNCPDGLLRTPLVVAAETGDEKIVDLLLSTGRIVPMVSKMPHDTPLIAAATRGHVGMMQRFLDGGLAEVNQRGEKGQTALIAAVQAQHRGAVDFLLAIPGLDITICDAYGRRAIAHAASRSNEHIVRSLMAREGDRWNTADAGFSTPFNLAIVNGMLGVVKVMLSTGRVDLDRLDAYGRSPLVHAVLSGRTEILIHLLKLDGVWLNQPNPSGWTPVEIAEANDQIIEARMIRALIREDYRDRDDIEIRVGGPYCNPPPR